MACEEDEVAAAVERQNGPQADSEEAVIQLVDEETIELNHGALVRIGGEWPEESKKFLDLFREIASSIGDQMEGGEWNDRTISIIVHMRAEDMTAKGE